MDTNTQTYYRISHTREILANRIPTLTQAQQVLELLRKDYPDLKLTIESYTVHDQD